MGLIGEGGRMNDESKITNDPETYHQCSAPRSLGEAKDDVDTFFAGVSELRVKHRIANVSVVAEVPTTEEIGSFSAAMFRGDHRIILHLVQALWSGLSGLGAKGKRAESSKRRGR